MADIDAAIERATGASVWSADAIGGLEGITRRLSQAQLDAIDAAVRATEGREATEVTRADFSAPEIASLMAAVHYDVLEGRGAALLSGIDVGRYDLEQFKRLHFGLGTYLGVACEQSPRHDRIGLVRKEPNPQRRGYLMDTELGPHTDFHEMMSLATFVSAIEGGVSGFVSAAGIYETIKAERPDLLAALEEGYYYPTSLESTTDYKVPTFSVVDGHVALYNSLLFLPQAAAIRGEVLPEKFVEALRYLGKVSRRPELMISVQMQPGEIVFWQNFRMLHSRTGFKNVPGRERTLLRLWLRAHEHYPMARGFVEIADILNQQHSEGWSMLVNTDESLRAAYELMKG